MDRGALRATVYGVAESDTTENIPHIYLHKYTHIYIYIYIYIDTDTHTHTHMVLLVKIKNLWTLSYPEQVMVNVST